MIGEKRGLTVGGQKSNLDNVCFQLLKFKPVYSKQ